MAATVLEKSRKLDSNTAYMLRSDTLEFVVRKIWEVFSHYSGRLHEAGNFFFFL